MNCIFCSIVKNEAPCHRVWESETHLAFLSIFPNTLGTTVVIPKKHYLSYFADLDDQASFELLKAAKTVAKILDKKLEGVGRTGLVFEGFGVDHIHAKLFPMHGTAIAKVKWAPLESRIDKYFERYEGYLSSHDGPRAPDTELAKLAKYLRGD